MQQTFRQCMRLVVLFSIAVSFIWSQPAPPQPIPLMFRAPLMALTIVFLRRRLQLIAFPFAGNFSNSLVDLNCKQPYGSLSQISSTH